MYVWLLFVSTWTCDHLHTDPLHAGPTRSQRANRGAIEHELVDAPAKVRRANSTSHSDTHTSTDSEIARRTYLLYAWMSHRYQKNNVHYISPGMHCSDQRELSYSGCSTTPPLSAHALRQRLLIRAPRLTCTILPFFQCRDQFTSTPTLFVVIP